MGWLAEYLYLGGPPPRRKNEGRNSERRGIRAEIRAKGRRGIQ